MAPVRFDAIASAVKKETHKNLYNNRYNEIMKEYDRDMQYNYGNIVQSERKGTLAGVTP